MASAWGTSWGSSFGNAWGLISSLQPAVTQSSSALNGLSKPERKRKGHFGGSFSQALTNGGYEDDEVLDKQEQVTEQKKLTRKQKNALKLKARQAEEAKLLREIDAGYVQENEKTAQVADDLYKNQQNLNTSERNQTVALSQQLAHIGDEVAEIQSVESEVSAYYDDIALRLLLLEM